MISRSKLGTTGKTNSGALVLSEIFPPTKGGSGKWLAEIYARMPASSCVMVVGKVKSSMGESEGNESYPHPIHRENLAMAFRGIAKLSSLRDYLRIFRRVCELAKQYRVATIHAARPLFEGLVARAVQIRLGVPYVCFVHGEDINVAMTSRELSLLTASVLRNADKLIANSHFTKELLLTDWKIPAERIELMHPGVDCEYYSPPPSNFSRKLFPENRQVLLTVGRLQERKGHDSMIYALSSIQQKHPDVLYAIAGDGEQRQLLQRLVTRLNLEDHVLFLGEIQDHTLRQCYQECDIFVLPNRTIGRDVEGFGIVLIEAQACGKPVIAGRSGGTADALVTGKTGLLVDCQNVENPQDLTAAVCSLLENPEQRLNWGEAGRNLVETTFDWSMLAKQAERILLPPPRHRQ